MLGWENKTPYHIYTSKQTFEKHTGILPSSSSKIFHFILIKDFDKCMTNKTNQHTKKTFSLILFTMLL